MDRLQSGVERPTAPSALRGGGGTHKCPPRCVLTLPSLTYHSPHLLATEISGPGCVWTFVCLGRKAVDPSLGQNCSNHLRFIHRITSPGLSETGWQPFTCHDSPFSELLGVDGFLNSEILDLKKRIGSVYPTCPNTLRSLGRPSTTRQ